MNPKKMINHQSSFN